MQAFQILDIKGFMEKLLIDSAFDHFLLSQAAVTTFCTFTIDGHFFNEYFSDSERPPQSYPLWSQVRPFCFSLIKGKRSPLEMKIVFRLSDANAGRLLSQNGIPLTEEDIEGLYLNIRYDGKGLTCITGTSLKLFTLDRTLELAWDRVTGLFLKRQGIPHEAL